VHAAWLAHRERILSPAARLLQKLSPFHRYILDAERQMFAHPALRAVICNSPMVADEISQYYGLARSKLHVIYNGIDAEDFHPRLAAHRLQVRQQAGIPDAVPLLLFVGSGFERKGVPQLLQALVGMQRRDAHLVIVGADRKLKAMRRLAESLGIAARVSFTGPLKDVRPWYGAADAFVLPTLYDPCPNAVLEAMACGLPTLTSTTCGAQVWIREGDNGFVRDALDIAALGRAMDALCELGRQETSRQSARAAVSELSLAAMAEQLLALYRTEQSPA
jgi:UDP-glucose:(heptosyl)LPS alpha-1,3-glucosyltransferase